MISDKTYVAIIKRVDSVINVLNKNSIKYEVHGDTFTFSIAPTVTILTDKCTIEVANDKVTINDEPVSDIEEMIDLVIEIEGI